MESEGIYAYASLGTPSTDISMRSNPWADDNKNADVRITMNLGILFIVFYFFLYQ